MRHPLLAFCFLVGAALLTGCASPIVDETGPLAIRSVSVTARPTVKSVTDMVPPLQETASRNLVGGDPAGTPSTIQISIDRVMYKNAVMSLLVGSVNGLDTTVTVSAEDGRVLKTFNHSVVLDAALNGIVGAAIAIGQDQANVDRKLVEAYGPQIKQRIYGAPGHKPKVPTPARPAVSSGSPVAASPALPAAKAAPAVARPTPVPTS